MFEGCPSITVENAHLVRLAAVITQGNVCSLAWSPDSKMLAMGDYLQDWSQDVNSERSNKTCLIWVYRDGDLNKPFKRLHGHTNTIRGLAFNNISLASAAYDSTVRFWDVQAGIEINQIQIPNHDIHNLA